MYSILYSIEQWNFGVEYVVLYERMLNAKQNKFVQRERARDRERERVEEDRPCAEQWVHNGKWAHKSKRLVDYKTLDPFCCGTF